MKARLTSGLLSETVEELLAAAVQDEKRGHVDAVARLPVDLARPVGSDGGEMVAGIAAAREDPRSVGDRRRHALRRRPFGLPEDRSGKRIEARDEVAADHDELV